MNELYPIIRRVRRPLLLEDPSPAPVAKSQPAAETPPAPVQPEPNQDADKTGNATED